MTSMTDSELSGVIRVEPISVLMAPEARQPWVAVAEDAWTHIAAYVSVVAKFKRLKGSSLQGVRSRGPAYERREIKPRWNGWSESTEQGDRGVVKFAGPRR
jgi:hypothetical protein